MMASVHYYIIHKGRFLHLFLLLSLAGGDKSIAHLACKHLHLDTSKWNALKEHLRESIRIRRANSNTAMKKEYFGKSN